MMSFFDEDPYKYVWYEKKTSCWLGVPVSIDTLIARTTFSALYLENVIAFPDGFEFTISAKIRGPLAAKWNAEQRKHFADPNARLRNPGESLVLAIWHPDGTGYGQGSEGESSTNWPETGMRFVSGGSSVEAYSRHLLAWPLPSENTMQLVVEWPDGQIDHAVIELNAKLLREAGQSSEPIWNEDADRPSHEWLGQ